MKIPRKRKKRVKISLELVNKCKVKIKLVSKEQGIYRYEVKKKPINKNKYV